MTAGPGAWVPDPVLAAFGVQGKQHRIAGGTGRSIRVGEVVLKPADDPAEAEWAATVLADLPADGFRIARPIQAQDGRWTVDGWAASTFLAGTAEPQRRWAELLAASRRFHAAMADIERPPFIATRTDQWAIGDRVAWGETQIKLSATAQPLLTELLARLRPISARSQPVHGDLSGNVLFADGEPPAVIDFSPYWRPVTYAEAIVAVDALLWYDADPGVIELLDDAAAAQMLSRALVFRLVAEDIHAASDRRPPAVDDYVAVARLLARRS